MVTYARDAMIEEVWKIVLDDIVYLPLYQSDGRLADAREPGPAGRPAPGTTTSAWRGSRRRRSNAKSRMGIGPAVIKLERAPKTVLSGRDQRARRA